MKPPKLPSGRRPIGLPTGGGSEKLRLAFLLALLVVFLGGYLYFRFVMLTESEQPPDEGLYITNVDDSAIAREPAATVDFSRLSEVTDSSRTERLIREPDAYTHLLTEARKLTPGDLDALGLAPLDAEGIAEDPGLYRGHPFEVKGFLESIEVVQGRIWEEVRGWLRRPDGGVVAFSVLREPNVEVGQVVRLQGFFFKMFALETEPGTYVDDAIYLVGNRLFRSFLEMPPVEDLTAVPFDQARDYDVTDMVELQEELLYPVLSFAAHLDDEARAALTGDEVTWQDLRRRPDDYRGKVVRILVRYVPGLEWPRELGPGGENPIGIRHFSDGIFAQPGNRLIRWIGIEPFPKEILQKTKLVYLTGVFVKNYAWENNRGEILNGPLLVPLRFKPFYLPKNEALQQIAYGIAGVTFLLIVVFFVLVFRDSRRSEQFRREFLSRKRRRLDRVLAEAGGDTSDPRPPPTESPAER